jgi:hypothetical protein
MSSYWIWLVVSTASMEASSYFLGWTSPGKWQKLQALNCRYLYSLCWCLFRLHVFWVQTTRWQHVSPSYSHSNVQFHLKIPPITRKRMRASSLKINDLFQFIADLIPNRTEIIKTCLKAQPKYIYIYGHIHYWWWLNRHIWRHGFVQKQATPGYPPYPMSHQHSL